MSLRFTKMHGLGNDFMVVDAISQAVSLPAGKIRQLADRHTGIGFDQLLLVESPSQPDVDFSYRIFNADGGEVGQCGNGARCFAAFVRAKGLSDKTQIRVNTRAGLLRLALLADGQVQVDMGRPDFKPQHVPLNVPAQQERYTLEAGGQSVTFGAVSMGNPHAVQRVDDVDNAPVATLGAMIESHALFPERVNAGFMQIVDRTHICLRVFERGAGETLACGSGACAAVVIGRLWGLLDDSVEVELRGGKLLIQWTGNNDNVLMTGTATHVYDGVLTN